MQPSSPASLRDALTQAARFRGLEGRMLFGAGSKVPLADLVATSRLGPDRDGLAGRSVLLATSEQFLAAIALVELDGLARRIVLCPPDLPHEHIAGITDLAGIDAVVSDRDPAEFPSGLRTVPFSDAAALPRPPAHWPTEWVMLTSGTTGMPKMVSHTLAALTGAIRPGAADAAPSVWSTFYDIRRYGGLQIYLRGMLGTGSLVLSAAGEPVAAFLERLGRHGATHVSGTPSHWRRVLMSPARRAMSPRYVRLSGEIADQAVLDNLRAAFPDAAVGHAYASTEAGVAFEVDDGREGFPPDFLGRKAGGVELDIREGSLRIRSPRTASGYVGSPGLALADPDGFVDTGDMIETRGERCHFVGRRGGIVNVGGLKVHPEEVEAVLNGHPRVRMSLVEARRSPITGAVVAASVVLDGDPGDGEFLRSDILAHCRHALPPYKVPAVLRFVSALDVTAAGKLERRHA